MVGRIGGLGSWKIIFRQVRKWDQQHEHSDDKNPFPLKKKCSYKQHEHFDDKNPFPSQNKCLCKFGKCFYQFRTTNRFEQKYKLNKFPVKCTYKDQ